MFEWRECDKELSKSPFWGYWFARHVIGDHWPAAEDFIRSDKQVGEWYNHYTFLLRSSFILGHSTGEDIHSRRLAEDRKRIKEKALLKQKRATQSKLDVEELADRLADEVSVFKKTRKMDREELDDIMAEE